MSYIQLPEGLKKNVGHIQLNIPKDEKARDLLEHLPYLAHLKDLIFQNKVENLLKNREDLQTYLLATEDLNRTIEDSLQLAVTHEKLNDASAVTHVSERDNPKYNFFKKNDNPLDLVYCEQAKFDVQNPIIGSLLKQINRGRLTDENVKKVLSGAPDATTLDVEDRFRNIFEREKPKDKGIPPDLPSDYDNDDDDFGPPGSPKPPPPPPSPPLGYVPRPGAPDDQFIADRPGREYFFPYAARTEKTDSDFRPPIILDGNLREVFHDADQALNNEIDIGETNEYADFSEQLDRGEIPEELQFFSGGEGMENLYREIRDANWTAGNQDIIEYLATDECRDAIERDGITMHVSSGDIYVNNENTEESLYTFLNNQQDQSKKEIPLGFTYDDDYTDYMTKYLPAINEFDEVKHDFRTNKNSKFLFHLFNKYEEDRGRPKYPIRHSTLTDDNYGLSALKDRNWPYFISRTIEYSQGFLNLSDLTASDATESNTRANFEIVKGVYGELFTSVGINLHELFKIMGYITKQRIDTDLTNNNFFPWDPNEQHIQNRILTTYRDSYYETGRFPGRSSLISVPRVRIPEFIRSQDVLSPRSLYKSYVGRDMQGIVSVQFLAAFNRFLGGDTEVSRDAMSELFHNLSWQALTNDNDSIMPQFDTITTLVKNIKPFTSKRNL